MGMDIFLYIERKCNRLNKWELVYANSQLPHGRSQYSIDLLTGIFKYGMISFCPPRGIPEDASMEYKKATGEGYHSHSYITLDEFESFDWDTKPSFDENFFRTYKHLAGSLYNIILPIMRFAKDEKYDDVRLLFFFNEDYRLWDYFYDEPNEFFLKE